MFRKAILIISITLFLPFVSMRGTTSDRLDIPHSGPFIVIDKANFTLILADSLGNVERQYGIACAENYGNKREFSDHKTPEGLFHINQILYSNCLVHDFQDGKGPILYAYGPWFFRLDIPNFYDIGIHGTHLPESIGSRCTEGCIRMTNEDIMDLKPQVRLGMPVLILPDSCRNMAIREPAEKVYDIAFISKDLSPRIEYMIEAETNGGRTAIHVPEDFSVINESIISLKSSRNVVFEEDSLNSTSAVRQILMSYSKNDSTIKCLSADSLYHSYRSQCSDNIAVPSSRSTKVLLVIFLGALLLWSLVKFISKTHKQKR